jgi:quinol-cytochrome oxidoreductase complex cytochrome b subunit
MDIEYTTYFLSLWQWAALIVVSAASIMPAARILRRAVRSPWFAIFFVIPFMNLIALWVFAYSSWPAVPSR